MNWKVTADQFGHFVTTNGRWPRKRSPHPYERHLSAFWHAQRRALLRPVPTEVGARRKRAHLTKVAPGWGLLPEAPPVHAPRKASTTSTLFVERVERLAQFRADTDRWPRTGTGNTEETKLARWLARLASADLTALERTLLEARTPGWANPTQPRGTEHFRMRVKRLACFIADHDAHPALDSPERAEANLAAFMAQARRRAKRGRLSVERTRILDEQVPSWFGGAYEHRWYARAGDLIDFYHHHGRHPRRTGKTPGEPSLARFRSYQVQTLLGGKADTPIKLRRRGYLNDHILGWDTTAGPNLAPMSRAA